MKQACWNKVLHGRLEAELLSHSFLFHFSFPEDVSLFFPGRCEGCPDALPRKQQRQPVPAYPNFEVSFAHDHSQGLGTGSAPQSQNTMGPLRAFPSLHRLHLHPDPLLRLQLVSLLRCRPEVSARGRERSHLLLLYPLLCEGITCKDSRLREMVKDVLLLAGAELGLGLGTGGGAGSEAAAGAFGRGGLGAV